MNWCTIRRWNLAFLVSRSKKGIFIAQKEFQTVKGLNKIPTFPPLNWSHPRYIWQKQCAPEKSFRLPQTTRQGIKIMIGANQNNQTINWRKQSLWKLGRLLRRGKAEHSRSGRRGTTGLHGLMIRRLVQGTDGFELFCGKAGEENADALDHGQKNTSDHRAAHHRGHTLTDG